jgi:dUTP pyrophosphatase
MEQPVIKVKKLVPEAKLPVYAKPGDAGADLSAVEVVVIPPGHRSLVRTGLAFGLPPGWMVRVASRSGLAVKYGIEKGAGTIDEGYTGEIMVLLHNTDPYAHFNVVVGDRIGQAIVQPYWQAAFEEVEELPQTARGAAGFGSSGR